MTVARYKPKKPPERQPTNLFQKGQPRPNGAGRRLGQPNSTTKLLKDALSGSAEQLGMLVPVYRTDYKKVGKKFVTTRTTDIIGWRATGEGGMQGYLVWLGIHYPRSYAMLLGRLLPIQVNAKVGGSVSVTEAFKGRDIKSMTLPEKMAAMKEIIGLTQPLALSDDSNIVDAEFSEAD